MPTPSPIFLMALFTMSASLGFGIWQLRSVEKELAKTRARARRRTDR